MAEGRLEAGIRALLAELLAPEPKGGRAETTDHSEAAIERERHRMKLVLTAEQCTAIAPFWAQATAGGCGHVVAGQIRRDYFPADGSLYLDVHFVARKTAEAMRAARIRAESVPATGKPKVLRGSPTADQIPPRTRTSPHPDVPPPTKNSTDTAS